MPAEDIQVSKVCPLRFRRCDNVIVGGLGLMFLMTLNMAPAATLGCRHVKGYVKMFSA